MSMSSFGTYEPSDAILAAVKARVGKTLLAGVGEHALDNDAPKSVPQTGVLSAPGFRLNGGLRDSVPPEHQNLPAPFPVAETGGIAFVIKEANSASFAREDEGDEGEAELHNDQGAAHETSPLKSLSGEKLVRGQGKAGKPSLGHNMRRQAPASLSVIDEHLNVASYGSGTPCLEHAEPQPLQIARPSSATSSRKPSARKAMQEAADEHYDRVLAQASAGLDMDIVGLDQVTQEGQESQSTILKLPSAVTVAGEPVAATGDMIYLGGGLYASCAPPPEKPKKKASVRKPPRRPASVMRSGSAQIVGSTDDIGSPQSQAHSDGQMGSEPFFSEGGRGSSRHGSLLGSSSNVGALPGPKIWRPAGVQKLPPAKLIPPAGFGGRPSRLSQEDLGRMPGDHAEERACSRRVHGKDGLMLFGPKGVLAHMRDSAEPRQALAPPGPPQGISKRLQQRKLAKQARIHEILEEREMRMATEAAINMHKRHHVANMARHASAPELSSEELERQRDRVACKMDILDFFHGYRKVVNKLTEEQQKVLRANLHGSGFNIEVEDSVADVPSETGAPSIQDRLQKVNDTCNRVFEPDLSTT